MTAELLAFHISITSWGVPDTIAQLCCATPDDLSLCELFLTVSTADHLQLYKVEGSVVQLKGSL